MKRIEGGLFYVMEEEFEVRSKILCWEVVCGFCGDGGVVKMVMVKRKCFVLSFSFLREKKVSEDKCDSF